MRMKELIFIVLLVVCMTAVGQLPQASAGALPASAPSVSGPFSALQAGLPAAQDQSNRYRGQSAPGPDLLRSEMTPDHLTHPCGGLAPEPAFYGLSPLAIAYVPGMCSSGYGDIGVWQAGGHSYVVQSGFSQRMFHLWNVDNPYAPVALVTQPFPSGGTTSTSAFPFKQGNNHYISITMRGSGTGCGFFVYNVNDPANPLFVARKSGADWCTPHEHFVSTDQNGDADYAWLAMGSESGSGYKAVVLDIHDLTNIVETGRYQRPDASSSIFVHDVTVIGNRVFLAHWGGGVIVHDKDTLAHNTNPTPLNPIDSIRPSGFNVHHSWPTSDGNHLFIEDEFLNSPSVEKVKLYNISNITSPFYETGIIGADSVASSQAHNLKIQNISPGLDRLYVGWYKAGTRGFEVDTTASPPVITATIKHQLTASAGSGFGGAWGVDYLPCTLHGQAHTCVYTSDYSKYGLVVDALGYDASLDPYAPESQVTDPTNGQTITSCSYVIQGSAHDYYSGVTQVEVSTDGGATWSLAQGTGNWTYQWNIPGDGPYTIKSRATDLAGNVEVPAGGVSVTVAGACGAITATATPSTAPSTTPTLTTTATAATATTTGTTTSTAATTPTRAPTQTLTASPTATAVDTTTPSSTALVPTATATATSISTVTATSTACPIQFTDVPSANTFYPYIRCMACRGIVSGYPCGGTNPQTGEAEPCNAQHNPYFRYNNAITRGQISKLVSNAAGFSDNPGPQIFEDVSPASPFFPFVNRLSNRRVIGGYPCGTTPSEPCIAPSNRPYFRPSGNASRGQISKIVELASGATLIRAPAPPQFFEDVLPGSPFYIYVEELYASGTIGGYPCGGTNPQTGQVEPCVAPGNRAYVRPSNTVTRGQSAKIASAIFFPDCQTP